MDKLTPILDVLNQQKQLLQNLSQILASELTAISQRHGDALVAVSQQKEQHLQQIQANDKTLQKLGFQDVLRAMPALQQQADDIRQLLASCKAQNETNYHAALQTQIAVDKIRKILFGDQQNKLYNAKGTAQSGSLLGGGIKA